MNYTPLFKIYTFGKYPLQITPPILTVTPPPPPHAKLAVFELPLNYCFASSSMQGSRCYSRSISQTQTLGPQKHAVLQLRPHAFFCARARTRNNSQRSEYKNYTSTVSTNLVPRPATCVLGTRYNTKLVHNRCHIDSASSLARALASSSNQQLAAG